MEAITVVRELRESGRSFEKSDYSVKILKLTRDVQRLTGLVELKDLEVSNDTWTGGGG